MAASGHEGWYEYFAFPMPAHPRRNFLCLCESLQVGPAKLLCSFRWGEKGGVHGSARGSPGGLLLRRRGRESSLGPLSSNQGGYGVSAELGILCRRQSEVWAS